MPATHTYVGITATTFKERLSNHKISFNKEINKNATTLSQFIWSLKDQNIDYSLHWRKLDQATPFNPNFWKMQPLHPRKILPDFLT